MSDEFLKQFLGRILGEVLRVQKKLDMNCPVSDGTIYGLLNGIEVAIDSTIGTDGLITKKQHDDMVRVMNKTFNDPEQMAKFTGYYDIEDDLSAAGIDRGVAIELLTYWFNKGSFVDMIRKMDSSNSPGECRTFKLDEFDV